MCNRPDFHVTSTHKRRTGWTVALIGILMTSIPIPGFTANGPDWKEIQEVKHESLQMAARNAMEQQKRAAADPVSIGIPGNVSTVGDLQAQPAGDGSLRITANAAPIDYPRMGSERLRFDLPEAVNMLENHSGLALIVHTAEVHPEVRLGVRLIGSNGESADIVPTVPLLSHWEANPHEIYLDWAFINYADVEDAIAVLESVVSVEFAVASARRSPERGPSDASRQAQFTVSGLRLVDYLKGSFDPNRHSWGWDGGDGKDLTLQHRVQEISGVVARFGGEEGLESAVESLDLAVRTQCWDGSFLDGRRGARTVASGEYTHGFTLSGLMNGYEYLEEIALPALDEAITVGPETMSRRDFYQRMLYRGGMSRAAHTPTDYRDDIIGGNTLVTGANRVLGYAIAMRRIVDLLEDPERSVEVRAAYEPIMREIAGAQGAFSGGFPLLAEGNRYDGRGIHYDAGYIRTHMDWLIFGIRKTGEPLLVTMLERYQRVIEAAMNEAGTGIMRLRSERGPRGGPVRLILPDATAQVGLEHNLPVMAQWGYNVGMPTWARWEPGERLNHFTSARHMRGYGLGAHVDILLGDIHPEPEPCDIGYRFPREFPIWSSRFYQKEDGRHTRTSRVHIAPDGSMENDFRIEVGEFLETIGVPVWLDRTPVTITAEAVALDGWPALLPDGAELHFEGAVVPTQGTVNHPVELRLAPGRTRVVAVGPPVTLSDVAGGATVPFRAEFILSHQADEELSVSLRLRNDTPPYEHVMPGYPPEL